MSDQLTVETAGLKISGTGRYAKIALAVALVAIVLGGLSLNGGAGCSLSLDAEFRAGPPRT